MKIKLLDIKIGERFRKDFGNINSLAAAIKEDKLIQPIAINEDKELIDGQRRIEAYKKLGIRYIPVFVVNRADIIRGQISANNNRKDWTTSERVAIYKSVLDFVKQNTPRGRPSSKSETKNKKDANLACLQSFPSQFKGEVRENIVNYLGGAKRSTLKKEIEIVEAVEKDPNSFQEILDRVDKGLTRVNKAHHKIKDILKIQKAEKEALSYNLNSNLFKDSNTKVNLMLGPMQEKGLEIANNSVDMIFTDPPYKREYLYLYDELAKLAERVLKPGGHLCTFAGHYALPIILDKLRANSQLEYAWQFVVRHTGHSTIIWNIEVWPGYKPLLWFYKPDDEGRPSKFDNIADVIKNDFIISQPVDKVFHKWEQSVIEADHLIKPFTVRNQIVLDPFMGSGTTGEATLNLGRKFIGIEINKVHYSNAAQRLAKFMVSTK